MIAQNMYKNLSTAVRNRIEYDIPEWFDFMDFADLCEAYGKKHKIVHKMLCRLENEGKLESRFGLSKLISCQKIIPSYRIITGKSVIAITARQNKIRHQTEEQRKNASISSAMAELEKWLLKCTAFRVSAGIEVDNFGKYLNLDSHS